MKRAVSFFLTVFLALSICAQIEWHDPMDSSEPMVCGRAWNAEIGKTYHRLPQRLQGKVPSGVWGNSMQSAGLSVRFVTDSRDVYVRYTLSNSIHGFVNMAPLNHSGVDLYAYTSDEKAHWIGNHMRWDIPQGTGDTITFKFEDISIPEGMEEVEYMLYLPPYNTVTSLQVGVTENSCFLFRPDSDEKPIVIYGSSIVQGASPSRPGLMWTNIIGRELKRQVINLGFSGCALMEFSVFEVLAEIDAACFIIDPIPNSYRLGEGIVDRAVEGIRYLRSKSEAPILMVEIYNSPDSIFQRTIYDRYAFANSQFRKAYELLSDEGIPHLYYLTHEEIGFSEDAMIESTHPNDIGNLEYARSYVKKLNEIFGCCINK